MEILLVLSFFWMLACFAFYVSGPKAFRATHGAGPIPSARFAGSRLRATTRSFLFRLFILAFLIRLLVVGLINATDAIRQLGLSPDSLRYHREGVLIAQEMEAGFFNWPNWIDNAWFQFTGLVYHLLGPYSLLIQLINITLGALTPIVVFHLVYKVYRDEWTARTTAILTAFFPSFIYWSSLMLKDPLSIFAMALLVLSVVGIRERFSLAWLAAMAFSLLVFLGIREYLFFVAIFLILMSFFPVEGRRTVPLLISMMVLLMILGASTHLLGFGFLGFDYIATSHYFDLEYINQTRINIGDHGSGAFFTDPSSALWGEDLISTLKALVAAVYFFFVTLDLSTIGSVRQLMALPEVLLTILLLPCFFRGLVYSWRHHRQQALPLVVFTFGLLAVYGSATTNMGAMFRWRMQAMPFMLAIMVYGVLIYRRGIAYRLLRKIRI